MNCKRMISLVTALLMLVLLPLQAFAAEYDLAEGSVSIHATETDQTVTHGDKAPVSDSAPVIIQSNNETATTNTVTITSEGDAVAQVTVQNVNISGNKDLIDVGDSNANVTLSGDNTLTTTLGSAVHVADGNLTIDGDGSLELQMGEDAYPCNAIIGSHASEDMSGSIHITGDVTIHMQDNEDSLTGNGAGIGSGDGGDMSGDITIDGNAKVTATSMVDGAGIGSGYYGDMSGSITIGENAEVHATSSEDGAGIGSGYRGEMSGSITIGGDAKVTAWNEDDGAGIGSGYGGEMSGSVTIGGNAQVSAGSDCNGAGIGSGYSSDMSGSVTIGGDAKVTAWSKVDGAGIGSGDGGDMSGDITIGGNAQVSAWSKDNGAGIGSGDEGKMSGSIAIGEQAQVTAWSKDEGAGIGSGKKGDMSGSIVIGGDAQVTAGAGDDAAGIGSGDSGRVTDNGYIDIKDNATVTAVGRDDTAGIGAGRNKTMAGTIVIRGNSNVTAIAGDCGAAIGSDDEDDMLGTIMILENATVTTGVEDSVSFDYDDKTLTYTLDTDYVGYIGDGDDFEHDSEDGHYVIGPNVTINGVNGSDVDGLTEYVNIRLDDGPVNLTLLDIQEKDGVITVIAEGEGAAQVLYNGREELPTEPGKASVTIKLDFGNDEVALLNYRILPEEADSGDDVPKPVSTKAHTHYFGDWTANADGHTHSASCKHCSHVSTVKCTEYGVIIGETEYKVCPVCGRCGDEAFAIVEGAAITGSKLPCGKALVRGMEAPFEGVLYAFTAGHEYGGRMEEYEKPVTISLPLSLSEGFRLVTVEGEDWDDLAYTYENGILRFEADEAALFLILPAEAYA